VLAGGMLEGLWLDGVGLMRQLRRAPAFFLFLLSTLAVAIGINAAIFAYVHTLLLQQLPVQAPHELATIDYRLKDGQAVSSGYSMAEFRAAEALSPAFAGLLARGGATAILEDGTVFARVNVEIVSGNYFDVLGVQPTIGRLLNTGDDSDRGEPYPVVVGHGAWRRYFGGSRVLIGAQIRLNGRPFRVAGIPEARFQGTSPADPVDFIVPLPAAPLFKIRPSAPTWLKLMGRLKLGVDHTAAQSMIRPLMTQFVSSVRAGTVADIIVSDGSSGFAELTARFRMPAAVLMMASSVVLLIAFVNVAGLLLARTVERRQELALRAALGATRTRLGRQLVLEGAVLALIGSCGALVVARSISRWLAALLYDGRSARALEIPLAIPALIGTAVLVVVTALLVSALPAWRATTRGALDARTGHTGAPSVGRLRRLLGAGQIALSIVLVYGASVLSRSLHHLDNVDLGFEVSNVGLIELEPDLGVVGREAIPTTYARALDSASSFAGVESAALSLVSVLSGDYLAFSRVYRGPPVPNAPDQSSIHMVGAGYFSVLRTPILAGRDFATGDGPRSEQVAIVNERFASLYWPGSNPVGMLVHVYGDRTVIGIAKDAHYTAVREPSPPTVYVPLSQVATRAIPGQAMTLVVRTAAPLGIVLPRLRQRIVEKNSQLLVRSVKTLEGRRREVLASERSLTFLSQLFAGVATLLAFSGLGGLIAYTVSTRKPEIAVRMALGADRTSVIRLFVRENLEVVFWGIAVGVPTAWAAASVLDAAAFGVRPQSIAIMFVVVLLLALGCIGTVVAAVFQSLHSGLEWNLRTE